LSLEPSDFDSHCGQLRAGLFIYRLHPLTVEALSRIAGPRERLLPWLLDPGARRLVPRYDRPQQFRHQAFYMLIRQYRALLWRANLPHVSSNLFDRLRRSAGSNVLNLLIVLPAFRPRSGKPSLPRTRDVRSATERAKRKPKPKTVRGRKGRQKIANDVPDESPRGLLRFFHEVYAPIRLANRPGFIPMRGNLRKLYEFHGKPVTLDDLSDELIERLMAWTIAQGYSAWTANGRRTSLLALWNYAYKKRYLDQPSRCVEKMRTPKRMPSAWTIEEFAKLLQAAEQLDGDVCGVPAKLWWPAFLLVLYQTGLRVGALLRLPASSLNWERQTLFVPAELQKQNADQAFGLRAETVAIVKAIQREEQGLLFPWKNFKLLRPAFRELLRVAGLPTKSRDLFHKIRRTTATHLADLAGDDAASKLLGHSSVLLTRTHYLDQSQIRRCTDASGILPRPDWKVKRESSNLKEGNENHVHHRRV
jgi:integrase